MVMVVMFMRQLFQLRCYAGMTLHCLSKLGAGKLVPGRRNDRSMGISLPQHSNSLIQLLLGNAVGAGHDDSGCRLNLVIIKLTKILAVYLNLTGVHHGNCIAQLHFVVSDLINCANHIGKLTHAGGLNNDSLRGIVSNHLVQCFAKVAYQAAANTAGIHFRNVDAGILQESAINADLAKFVLDEHQFLPVIMLADHLFDQGRLARSEKTGVNIDFCHGYFTFY